MSDLDPRGPAEFEPVRIGPRRRRVDPVALGVVLILAALALAVIKPWGGEETQLAAVPSASPATSPASPQPSIDTRGALVPPLWEDVRSVVERRDEWGIRTIVLGATPDPETAPPETPTLDGTSAPSRYAERWFSPVEDGGTTIVDEAEGSIIALGVTFPQNETPLDVRIWLDHGNDEFEWMDVHPINDVPARGAYLYLRRGVAGAAVRAWPPGRYRADILVGDGIRRMDVVILDHDGRLPAPDPSPPLAPRLEPFDGSRLAGLPPGPFLQADGAIVALDAAGGPPLDDTGAWLDVDASGGDRSPTSFVARTYQPGTTHLGVALPAYSTVRTASVRRLAPLGDASPRDRQNAIGSLAPISFVAFSPRVGETWRPGVYAMSVAWDDGDGPHDRTWHVELRPGPLPATPVMLSATRAWARFVGSSGVLLGSTGGLTAPDPLGIRLVDIVPQIQPGYPGLSGSDVLGCGATIIRGRPEVIGIVGRSDQSLAPVASRVLYPFPDVGPLEVLTASGAVPGLTLVAPVVTAEFGGQASYGFRAGTEPDAPGYTICIGMIARG